MIEKPSSPAPSERPGELSLLKLLQIHGRRRPDAVALAAPGRAPLSYGRLGVQVEDTIRKLHAFGLTNRDRVALALSNGPELAVATLAVSCASAAVPLNPAARLDEFDRALREVNAKALLIPAGADIAARSAARARGVPIIEVVPLLGAEAGIFALRAKDGVRPVPKLLPRPADVAVLLYTPGTTARPKLVPLSHANLSAAAFHIGAALRLVEHDRCLNVLPLFHAAGLIEALLASLVAGASVVCPPVTGAERFGEWVKEFRPTWFSATPAICQAVLEQAETLRWLAGNSPFRFVRSSSAPLPVEMLAPLEAAFRAPVIEVYGMTEAAHQIACNPLPPLERRPGSVGLPAGPEIAVMDEDGHRLGAGQVGEIVVRGDTVTAGYVNNAPANARAFVHDWFRTGDLGYFDADGYLFLTCRINESFSARADYYVPVDAEAALTGAGCAAVE
jgi:acyl-CoA synthetase (AMP-forming)/AMP-acid ligase II